MIVVGKVLAGGEPITPRLLSAACCSAVLFQWSPVLFWCVSRYVTACRLWDWIHARHCSYQVVEIAIQRRFKSQQGDSVPIINTHQNIAAFLDMLAYSKGRRRIR